MPEQPTSYLIEAAQCNNCGKLSRDLVVPFGRKLWDERCPNCGCKESLWRTEVPQESGGGSAGAVTL